MCVAVWWRGLGRDAGVLVGGFCTPANRWRERRATGLLESSAEPGGAVQVDLNCRCE